MFDQIDFKLCCYIFRCTNSIDFISRKCITVIVQSFFYQRCWSDDVANSVKYLNIVIGMWMPASTFISFPIQCDKMLNACRIHTTHCVAFSTRIIGAHERDCQSLFSLFSFSTYYMDLLMLFSHQMRTQVKWKWFIQSSSHIWMLRNWLTWTWFHFDVAYRIHLNPKLIWLASKEAIYTTNAIIMHDFMISQHNFNSKHKCLLDILFWFKYSALTKYVVCRVPVQNYDFKCTAI